jgi:hypothetical protein
MAGVIPAMTRGGTTPPSAAAPARGGRRSGEAVDKALQELLRAFVGDIALIVDQTWLERDVDLAAEQKGAEAAAEHLAQMRLRQSRTERAGRRAGNGDRLAGPVVLAPRPRAPIDRILEHGRDRTIVLRRDDQDAIGLGEFVLEAHDFGHEVVFVVLVVHRQIVDADEFRLELAGGELGQRLGELAIDRFLAVGADDQSDLGYRHG